MVQPKFSSRQKHKLGIDFTKVVAHLSIIPCCLDYNKELNLLSFRTPHGILGCKGTDANRNWGFHWNDGGSSSNSCSETYMGPEVWSEVENTYVQNS